LLSLSAGVDAGIDSVKSGAVIEVIMDAAGQFVLVH
jgi:hypothetical protein